MLEFGGTRVELGVQNPDDEVYKKVDRGHTVADVVEATRLLKDSAFKVNYHMMPGILGRCSPFAVHRSNQRFDCARTVELRPLRRSRVAIRNCELKT